MNLSTPMAQIVIDEGLLREIANEYVKEHCEKHLDKVWYTIKDLEHITGYGRTWIMEYIIEDPYVRKNGIAKRIGDGKKRQWRIDAERIKPFLKRLFDDAEY